MKDDLNAKMLPLTFNSPVFIPVHEDVNNFLIQLYKECYGGQFSGGEIVSRINITFEDAVEHYNVDSGKGQILRNKHEYKKMLMEHKTVLTLKKKHEAKGQFDEKRELVCDKYGNFYVSKLESEQMDVWDVMAE